MREDQAWDIYVSVLVFVYLAVIHEGLLLYFQFVVLFIW